MKIQNILATAIAPFLALPFLALQIQFTPSASAQSLSDCYVEIVGNTTGSRVNLRAGTGTDFRSPAYLLVGQSVNMLNNSSGERISREDRKGNTFGTTWSMSQVALGAGFVKTFLLSNVIN